MDSPSFNSCVNETVESYCTDDRLPHEAPFLEFFAGSGLVAEGMRGFFRPVWANDICEKKAAVYAINHGDEHFHLSSIAEINGVALPRAVLSYIEYLSSECRHAY